PRVWPGGTPQRVSIAYAYWFSGLTSGWYMDCVFCIIPWHMFISCTDLWLVITTLSLLSLICTSIYFRLVPGHSKDQLLSLGFFLAFLGFVCVLGDSISLQLPQLVDIAPAHGDIAPAHGYTAPAHGYTAPARGYTAPARGYTAPARGYTAPILPQLMDIAPARGYTAPAHGYTAPARGYCPPARGYCPPARGYCPPAHGYCPPAHGDTAPAPPPSPSLSLAVYPKTQYSAPCYSQYS
uniref:Uncharacterized protein n=1 Tax=Leptobrachium leishanense TaxID=445787 RepID=A0A8C5PZ42_9ANUR